MSANIPEFLAKKTVNVSIGAEADIAVFNLRERKFGFTDVRKISVEGTKKLEAGHTLRGGKIMWDLNGISGQPWKD